MLEIDNLTHIFLAKNTLREPFPGKPEVEMLQKPQEWTRSHQVPIRPSIHYKVYLEAWETVLISFKRHSSVLSIFIKWCGQVSCNLQYTRYICFDKKQLWWDDDKHAAAADLSTMTWCQMPSLTTLLLVSMRGPEPRSYLNCTLPLTISTDM